MIGFSQNDKLFSELIHHKILDLWYPTNNNLKLNNYKLGLEN